MPSSRRPWSRPLLGGVSGRDDQHGSQPCAAVRGFRGGVGLDLRDRHGSRGSIRRRTASRRASASARARAGSQRALAASGSTGTARTRSSEIEPANATPSEDRRGQLALRRRLRVRGGVVDGQRERPGQPHRPASQPCREGDPRRWRLAGFAVTRDAVWAGSTTGAYVTRIDPRTEPRSGAYGLGGTSPAWLGAERRRRLGRRRAVRGRDPARPRDRGGGRTRLGRPAARRRHRDRRRARCGFRSAAPTSSSGSIRVRTRSPSAFLSGTCPSW